MTRLATICMVGALGAACVATVPADAAVAAPKRMLSGPMAAGGTWTLSAERTRIGPLKGLCLHLQPRFADGSTSGISTGCAAGSLRLAGKVTAVSGRSGSGGTVTSSLVGGVVVARARVVRIRFADGKRKRVRAHKAPRGWRRALGARVRYYGADALSKTTANVRSVTAYDRRGRRVARTRNIKR